MSSRGHIWNPCIVPLRLIYSSLLNSEDGWIQYCSFTYRFQKCYNDKMYSTANILSSPLQPCLGEGCRLSQHSMASCLRDRKRMPPAPGWCGCSCKLRVSHRHLQGCEWVSLRVHSLLPRYSLRSLLSLGCSAVTLLLFSSSGPRLAHLPSSHYHCWLLPIKVLSVL